jgi:hypothetical protein
MQHQAAFQISNFANAYDFIIQVIRERHGKVVELTWEVLVNEEVEHGVGLYFL